MEGELQWSNFPPCTCITSVLPDENGLSGVYGTVMFFPCKDLP